MIVTRMAPSPTGLFHVGGLRTALYDYLLAKQDPSGIFFLRIEDTDRQRLHTGAIADVIHSFAWTHISPDQGVVGVHDTIPVQKGEYGPYIQSERLDIYNRYIDQLIAAGQAYYAFDTAEELEAMRQRQTLNKEAPRYDRYTMKNSFTLEKEDVTRRIVANEPHVVRMVIPDNEEISFIDSIRGEITFHSKEVDEQILRKSDGFPTYHLAVVVDDYLMKTTHVLRGEEWISSTPKHILLYKYFGWPIPSIGHLPVLVNETGKKLSKRHGDVAVSQYREKGYLPEALINFVALLGWNPGTEQEVFSLEELVNVFRIEQVQKKPAFFDIKKLDWFNQQWCKRLGAKEIASRYLAFVTEYNRSCPVSLDTLEAIVSIEMGRYVTFSELEQRIAMYVPQELQYDTAILAWKKSTIDDAKQKLQEIEHSIQEYTGTWSLEQIEQFIQSWIKEKGYGIGDVLWPLRVALSGQQHSPGPFEIAFVLGKEETLKRIAAAIKK